MEQLFYQKLKRTVILSKLHHSVKYRQFIQVLGPNRTAILEQFLWHYKIILEINLS